MADEASKNSALPGWYADGLEHIWLPYAQMKTVSPPLAGRAHAGRAHHLWPTDAN